MRRIFCLTGSGGEIAGAERSLLNFLPRSGFEFLCVVDSRGRFSEEIERAGGEVMVLPLRPITRTRNPLAIIGQFLGLLWQSFRLSLAGRRCELVLANKNVAIFHAAMVGLLLDLPVVWYVRNRAERFGLVGRLLSGFVDGIVFVSADLAGPFEAVFRRQKKAVVGEAIDAERFARRVAEARQSRSPGQKPVVACIGRLTRWKGQDIFLRAAELVGSECDYLIVGGCVGSPDELAADRLYEEQLKAFVAERKLPVRFVPFTDEVEKYYAMSDVVVMPSRREPFGIVMLEAMAAGVPLVASRSGGPALVLRDGVDALLFEEDNAEACAAAIKRLLSDAELRNRIVANAANRVRTRHAPDEFAALLRKFLEGV